MPAHFKIGIGAILVSILCGCAANKESLRKTLSENPEIIYEAMEKNPEKFAEAMQRISMEARRVSSRKAEEETKKEREEEFRNPKVPEIAAGRAVRGNADASITLVEYSDFQCPYCKRGFQTVEELRKKHGTKLRFVFKHLPLPFHPLAMPAAKRFEAIALQSPEKAYRFHDEVFAAQEKLSAQGEKALDKAAQKAGANLAQMRKDMESVQVKARIEADMNEAKKFGISGTPGYVLNGVTLKGAFPASAFEQVIADLEKHTSRGTASEN